MERREQWRHKKLPDSLLTLIRMMYSCKCKKCGVLANTSHMRNHHGVRIDLQQLLDRLQDSKW